MNIIVLGPPASGKGTQAKLLAKKLALQYLEMGDVLREIAKEVTPVGRKIDRIIHQEGKLVPDQMMRQIVDDWLKKMGTKRGIIFDGFPRSLGQFKILEELLTSRKEEIDKLIYLEVSHETSIKRLTARRICPQCDLEYNLITRPPKNDELCDQCQIKLIQRKDDTPEVIELRLKTYQQLTHPLVKYVRQRGILMEIDGERSIETIHQDIMGRLEK